MPILPEGYQGTVTSKEKISPTVFHLKLELDRSISYEAGQYASWLIGDARRPMSFALPACNNKVEFISDTAAGGIASCFIKDLTLNETIRLLAPYGRFTLDKNSSLPLLFIATGTGIAPLRAHIYEEFSQPTPRPITLIFGNRNQESQLLQSEFAMLAKTRDNFTYIPVCSDPLPAWDGECGMVTSTILSRIDSLSHSSVYICGNPSMVKDVVKILKDNKVPTEKIHTEQYPTTLV